MYNGSCEECHDRFKFPYEYCCLGECNEHEFCKGCNYGINVNHPDWPECVDPNHVMEESADEEEPAPDESEVYGTGSSSQLPLYIPQRSSWSSGTCGGAVFSSSSCCVLSSSTNPAKNKKSMRFNAEFYNMRK